MIGGRGEMWWCRLEVEEKLQWRRLKVVVVGSSRRLGVERSSKSGVGSRLEDKVDRR